MQIEMDTDEQIRQLILAQMMAYIALVNTLKSDDSINEKALIERLQRWSEQQNKPLTKEILSKLAAALSANAQDSASLAQWLH